MNTKQKVVCTVILLFCKCSTKLSNVILKGVSKILLVPYSCKNESISRCTKFLIGDIVFYKLQEWPENL